jgi:hypothetical protein
MSDFDFEKPARGSRFLKGLTGAAMRRIALSVIVLVALYIPVGMLISSRIEDDTTFVPPPPPTGASNAIAMTAALILRETDEHNWTPNDPFFLPGYYLDNTPEFQTGMMLALGRFSTEMMDQIGRTRGSSQTDPDLSAAVDYLKSAPDVWVWSPSVSLLPTTASDQKYRNAAQRLTAYNLRLSNGQALFERRADNLIALVDRISNDLGSMSAIIDQQILNGRNSMFDSRADNVFYGIKGRLYAYYLILREVGMDFQQVIRDREAHSAWAQMLDSLHESAILNPLLVMNGDPDGLFLANHLTTQGFYLLRARTQMREISQILIR